MKEVQFMLDVDHPPENVTVMEVAQAFNFEADIYFSDVKQKEAELILVTTQLTKLALLRSCFTEEDHVEELLEKALEKANDLVSQEADLKERYHNSILSAKEFCKRLFPQFIDNKVFFITQYEQTKVWFVVQPKP